MTMIEMVEGAISEACDHALPPHLLEKCARAAISAMREPTTSILEAGSDFAFADVGSTDAVARECWQACIDAALGKKPA